MDKLYFDKLQAEYELKSSYKAKKNENNPSTFSLIWHLDAYFLEEKDGYSFTIQRSNIRINEKEPDKLMDQIICEIGNSLYPLSLLVSPCLQIIGISNFEELKIRWKNTTDELLKKHPSHILEKYIRQSSIGLTSPQLFISRLYNDVFINLYFRDIYTLTQPDECRLIVWQNFPKRETNLSYLYQVSHPVENQVILSGQAMQIPPGQNGQLQFLYETGQSGEIKQINGWIETIQQEKTYRKEVTVRSRTTPGS